MPRWLAYQAPRAFGSALLRNTPPTPVTLAMSLVPCRQASRPRAHQVDLRGLTRQAPRLAGVRALRRIHPRARLTHEPLHLQVGTVAERGGTRLLRHVDGLAHAHDG